MRETAGPAAPTSTAASAGRATDLYQGAIAILSAEYDQPLSDEMVGRRVLCSPRALQRAFREADTTFYAALTDIRVAAASYLLIATRLPVREIAERVGYRNGTHLAVVFRRRHGLAPAAYRAQHAQHDAQVSLVARSGGISTASVLYLRRRPG